MRGFGTTILMLLCTIYSFGQEVPSQDENIPFLVTFGNEADESWGDDDFTQTFFFVIPPRYEGSFFIRVFDPENGGKNDEKRGEFDSKTEFAVYGGKGCISEPDARGTEPEGDYRSGNLLARETFGEEAEYDDQWYTFGPFDPSAGEFSEKYGGYIFKVIAQGIEGNDGNLYRYFLSTSKGQNRAIEGGNAFTFEYSFRLHAESNQISHVYPFIDKQVISIEQSNFDWDNDGYIRLISKTKKGELFATSGDNKWSKSKHDIDDGERNSSQDVQFIKREKDPLDNNNVVFFMTNQYGEFLPFFSLPIGGVPKYKYKIGVKPGGYR